jgi:hypothetical protein
VESLEDRHLLTATIVGRYVFYGDSVLDNGTAIDTAIAPDKSALLPGHLSTFANYTSYSKGVNGIAIDAVNWPAAPVASDFVLRAGNNSNPASWPAVSQPVSYTIQRGAGIGGSDRIILRLPDGAVRDEWLQITVNPTADTGLSTPDVFYFGNAPGDDGHNLTNAVVDSADVAGAIADVHGFLSPAPVTDLYDFNRDGRVDATDQLIARNNIDTSATALQMFAAPASSDPGTAGSFTRIFNVKQYGAGGKGVSDDTQAIQSAINAMTAAPAGGLLYFPAGTYRISSFLSLQGLNNFEIRGFGATLMPLDSDATANIGGDVMRISNCSDFTLSGLTFDGDSKARAQSDQPASLRVADCSDFRIAVCTFSNTVGDALYVCATNPADSATASHEGFIEGCSVNSAYRNAISLIHGYRVSIQSNLVQNVSGTAPQSGIDIEANPADSDVADHDLLITGNQFLNCAAVGLYINQPQHPTNVGVFANSFVNCPTGVINDGVNSRIDNNQFHDVVNPTSGPTVAVAQIYCGTAAGQTAEITGNIFYSVTGMSAIITGQTWTGAAHVAGNRISGFNGISSALISLWSDGATVDGNSVQTNGSAIAVTANNADIESNVLGGGSGDGIYAFGVAQTIRNNSVSGFVCAIEAAQPASASTATSAIDGNVVSACPTGVKDSLVYSEIDANSFSNVTLPASGPGATALAQIYLLGNTGGSVQISANSFTSLTGLGAVYVHPSWSGQATISNNQIDNVGPNAVAINVQSSGATIIGNNLQGVPGIGIGVTADRADIENNTVSDGGNYGIYVQGNQATLRRNTVAGRPVGVYVVNPVAGGTTALVTTVDSNTITNCPTALQDSVSNCSVTNNNFGSASLPTTGPGSSAVGQIYLVSVAGGVAQITGNTIGSLTSLSAIFIHASWSGRATIFSNQITGVVGLSAAFNIGSDNSVITGNTLQNVAATGIAATGNAEDIENNTVPGGVGDGIYLQGNGGTVRLNHVTGHPVGIEITDPAAGGSPTATTTVDTNTITNCPTGIRDTTTGSSITNNTLSNAALPASGPGSDALAEVYMLDVSNGSALVSGNTFNLLTGIDAILVHASWSGVATISTNQITNVTSANGIQVDVSNAAITSNTLQNIGGAGICVSTSSDDIENNNLTTGTQTGIYAQGVNHTIRNNTLVDFGSALTGQSIFTASGGGGTVIVGNTVRKTVPNPSWIPIVINPLDKPGVNYRYGVQGADGAFVPGVNSASLPVGAADPADVGSPTKPPHSRHRLRARSI